jgi:hypothetical protein
LPRSCNVEQHRLLQPWAIRKGIFLNPIARKEGEKKSCPSRRRRGKREREITLGAKRNKGNPVSIVKAYCIFNRERLF